MQSIEQERIAVPRWGMAKKFKYLTLAGKAVGFVAGLSHHQAMIEQFQNGKYAVIGLFVFAGASLAKDAINTIGDILDDRKLNKSFSIGEDSE